MADILDLEKFKNRDHLEKIKAEISASEVADKIKESYSQLEDGLISLYEFFWWVKNHLPQEMLDKENNMEYVRKDIRQKLLDKYSMKILEKLLKIANKLDKQGFYKEADVIDMILKQAITKEKYYGTNQNEEKQPIMEMPDTGMTPEQYKRYYGIDKPEPTENKAPSKEKQISYKKKEKTLKPKMSLPELISIIREMVDEFRNHGLVTGTTESFAVNSKDKAVSKVFAFDNNDSAKWFIERLMGGTPPDAGMIDLPILSGNARLILYIVNNSRFVRLKLLYNTLDTVELNELKDYLNTKL